MSGIIIDGREISRRIKEEIKEKLITLKEKYDKVPGIAVIYIGDDEASKVYTNTIIKESTKVGFEAFKYVFPGDVKEEKVYELINNLNDDLRINGIIIQFPVPKHIDEDKLRALISEEKDIDCANHNNIGKLFSGYACLPPCTPKGVIRLIKSLNIDLTGKTATVVGRSNIVGKPVFELLLRENTTVTICHSKTKDLKEHLINSDIVVAAVGRPKLIKGDYIKEGAIVIDVGTNVVESKLVGDVDFEEASKRAAYITPVPGGVGPMTIAMLLENTLEASIKQWKLEL